MKKWELSYWIVTRPIPTEHGGLLSERRAIIEGNTVFEALFNWKDQQTFSEDEIMMVNTLNRIK